jgi:hypothetical protein
MTDTLTTEEIARHYTAIGHSVDLINDVVAGNQDDNMEAVDLQDTVTRNVDHLEIMLAKDFWTTEDMSAANAAVTAGKSYVA